ncbi:hypothetical protein STRCI_001105 [Streptomyces cinnabarinus]|uniref:Phage tail protein n=1 Tax=Streptomyces cinnabarinus TaxID=67287 RepID=A0ABY7K8Q2_9ACTN|nr:hypothetical protein [Streptomyces cinnabarinus]WAZ20015.1 hypothetical protein STRCI_001105 [Streptomyces cinnabarinus]
MTRSLQLMLLTGDVLPVPAPAALVDALQSVQVTCSSGAASGFQLTFAVGKRSPVSQVMLPLGALDPKRRVVVVAVVSGMPHVLMDGVITRQELTPGTSPGTSQLTVTGEDLSLLMDLKHAQRSYPGLPHNLRAMMVCARYAEYGIVPIAVPPVISDLPNPAVDIPVQSGTDLAYLKSMAGDVGYVFFIEPGPAPGMSIAYWGPEVRAGLLQPALTVDSGAATNVESLSFGYDGLRRTQYTIPLTEPNTKITFQVPVPDISLLRPPLAARPATALREEPLPDLTDRSVPEALLLGLSRTSVSTDAVTGSGRLDVLRYGHVLSARHLVGVRGAGLAYDGVYYVRSVTHDIRRGEYKQSFTLSRDGLVSQTPVVIP